MLHLQKCLSTLESFYINAIFFVFVLSIQLQIGVNKDFFKTVYIANVLYCDVSSMNLNFYITSSPHISAYYFFL